MTTPASEHVPSQQTAPQGHAPQPQAPSSRAPGPSPGGGYNGQTGSLQPDNQPSYEQQVAGQSPLGSKPQTAPQGANDVDLDAADTDTPKEDEKEGGPPELAGSYSIGLSGSVPGGKASKKYADFESKLQVGGKLAFKPKDSSFLPAVGWDKGIKAELLSKEFVIAPPSKDCGVQKVELKSTVHTPLTDSSEKNTWLNVGAELKVVRGEGLSHSVSVSLTKAVREGGEWKFTGPSVDIVPLGKDMVAGPFSVKEPAGTVEGEISLAPTLTINPNWTNIMAKVAPNATTAAAGAAEAGIALESIGLLEIAAIAAPVAFAAGSLWAILDLSDAIDRKGNLGQDFRTAMAAYRGGITQGLNNGEAAKDGAAGLGFTEGKQRYAAGFLAFKKKAAGWVAAQREEGKSSAAIDAELTTAYDAKLKAILPQVVQRATASFDGALRKDMLKKYLDDHGDQWMSKPGLCYGVFKMLYPNGKTQPWTVPQATYERVRETCKGSIWMGPWSAKPTAKVPTPEEVEEKEERARHKGGLSMDFMDWCREYLSTHECQSEFEVEAAYLKAHPDHTVDDNARASLRTLVNQFIKHPEWRREKKPKEKPEKKVVPTKRQMDAARLSVWKAMERAKKARKKSGGSKVGEAHFKEGMKHRTAFVASGDIEQADASVQRFNDASHAWGVSHDQTGA